MNNVRTTTMKKKRNWKSRNKLAMNQTNERKKMLILSTKVNKNRSQTIVYHLISTDTKIISSFVNQRFRTGWTILLFRTIRDVMRMNKKRSSVRKLREKNEMKLLRSKTVVQKAQVNTIHLTGTTHDHLTESVIEWAGAATTEPSTETPEKTKNEANNRQKL